MNNAVVFDRPGTDLTSALQVGNGRLGANVYGEILREQVVLNENSMWSGSAENSDREGAHEYLGEIRRLLREGKNYEAQQLFAQHFTCTGKGSYYAHGTDVPFGCYQVLGRLHLSYFQAVSHGRQDSCSAHDYKRYLNLEEGIASVEFALGGKEYKREYLVSADRQAIYIHLTCTKTGEIDFACGLDRDECFTTEVISYANGEEGLLMHGQLADGYGTDKGIHYACALGVSVKGGQIFTEGTRLHVKEADEALIKITAATDMAGFMGKQACDPVKQAIEDLAQTIRTEKKDTIDWEEVKAAHLEWYRKQYEVFSIHFGEETEKDILALTTRERVQAYLAGAEDPGLLELYIQNSRHQMIGSSQKGGFPANLQGIWSDEILTPWNGDWHLNAQQMIYWLSEKANLSDNTLPYLELTKELVEPGQKTAQTYYGARGWLTHTFTNPWGFTSPAEDADWGSTTGSPAWQCHHLWEHYLYTGDREYLAWAYPIMKGAAEFYMDNLVENEKGQLVTSPSSSPENCFVDEEGRICSLCEGPAYDRELVASLVEYCIQAQYVLKNDQEFLEQLKEMQQRLAPVEIAPDGRIREWNKDFKEAYPFHRHLSHLWGVYPGNMISKEKTPELAAAAVKSLERRGRTTAGWAISFRAALWARLRNAEMAFENVLDVFRYAAAPNLMNLAYHCDEIEQHPAMPDLEHCRYPFQIDGNQGTASILLMMILDDDAVVKEDGSMESVLYLLPSLPEKMKTGSMRGLKTKGGYLVDLDWKDGNVTAGKITAAGARSEDKLKIVVDGTEREVQLAEGCYVF